MAETAKLQIQSCRNSTTSMRQVQEMNVAESECAELRRLLEEERKLVLRLKQENEDEAQMAKREIEKMSRLLAEAQKDVEYATTRADFAEIECAKLKRLLVEERKIVQRLILEKNEEAELAKRLLEKIFHELANAHKDDQFARKEADVSKNEWIKLKGELKEKEQFIIDLKLQIPEIRQITMRQVEDITQELEGAQKEAVCARYDAEIAKNEWIEAKKEMQEKIELVQLLKLECRETKESVMRHVEEKELELADALDAATAATSSSAVAKTCEERGMMLTTCPICRVEITHRFKLFPG